MEQKEYRPLLLKANKKIEKPIVHHGVLKLNFIPFNQYCQQFEVRGKNKKVTVIILYSRIVLKHPWVCCDIYDMRLHIPGFK